MNASYVELSYGQVALAAALVLVNAAASWALQLKLERPLLLASIRMTVQLLLVGLVLKWVFARSDPWSVLAVAIVMTAIAGVSAVNRTRRRYPGAYLDSVICVWASSWIMTAWCLAVVMGRAKHWFDPQYAIPLLGMILGNTLNGISLGLDRFGEELRQRRDTVEASLALGATRWEAARQPVQQAVRTGMLPTINAMMVAGIVSMPGMMTGQLLSGVEPTQAVKYQVAIMFLIAAGSTLGTVGVVLAAYRRLFNSRHQFRADLLA